MHRRSPLPVRGYHGTSRAASETILKEGFHPSQNTYDWLGTGIYFWQDAPRRAQEWAETRHATSAAVLEATISLIDCLDLLDIGWQNAIRQAYASLVMRLADAGRPLPRQTAGAHRLDRAVIDFLVGVLEDAGGTIRSVRAPFTEGQSLFPDSALTGRGHVQVAVRDPAVIADVRVIDVGRDHDR